MTGFDPERSFGWSALEYCAGKGAGDATEISSASARQQRLVFAQFGSQDVSAMRASSRADWSRGTPVAWAARA